MKTPWPLAVFFTVFVWAALPSRATPLPNPELIEAAQQGKVERLQALLQAGQDAALRDAQGYDALDYAIETDRRFNRMRPSIAPRKRHQAG